ncbi:tRNA lysidine(34) synthetase TilS [Phormidium sp. LEGE 05292]|uniref:tRNA lysidine(34) synthetase TilS n=1 Tax=[Phormidium] sp. LEGE 05292 TaxID=767427 RepID=UPI001882C33B|nr:tRNA lysidine(34) synthetase TilS [Phormidium sp. LEGE 05292]MBE9227957.1 tRNA lysidine(34) synthetase TilS [Phormidium sp. LEGE 05292]
MLSSQPWTPLHAQIHRTLRQRQLLPKNQNILIAVSGGQDSLCLTKLLLDLQSKWQWQLGICHCDHRWRTDSEANANHVGKLAQTWQLPFYLQITDQELKSEAAAREWRYQALINVAQTHNYSYIVTGHTASDRAETILYNLTRGSGADGLQSLTWQRYLIEKIQLIRPLLEITRLETAQFCADFQLPIWSDSTNEELKYKRNRIRLELIPYLKQNFNPQVEKALAQTAEILQAEVEFLENTAQEIRQKASSNSPIPQLNRSILRSTSLAIQRRVMRQFLQQNLGFAPSFEQIEKLTALITAPNRSCTDPFPGGAIAQVENDYIYLKKA